MMSDRFVRGLQAGIAGMITCISGCQATPDSPPAGPDTVEHPDDTDPLTDDDLDAQRIASCDPAAVHAKYGTFLDRRRYALAVHRLRHDDGSGGLSDGDLGTALSTLNRYFAPMNVEFVARTVEDVNSNEYVSIDSRDERFDMMQGLNATGSVINVYFVQRIYGGISGAASFPHYSVQGIVLTNSAAVTGTTLPHEMGHFFNLLHTHQGLGAERVDRVNCDREGDLLCSTPADPGPRSYNPDRGCQYDAKTCSIVSCGRDDVGMEYAPNIGDLMSYYPDVCNDSSFGVEQQQLMSCTMERIRTDLVPLPASKCVGPYHVVAPDGQCVWSCAQSTMPDNATGECVCQPGLVESGVDGWGRRVCVNVKPMLRYTFDGTSANSGSLAPAYGGSASAVDWVVGKHGQAIRFRGTTSSVFRIASTAAVFSSSPRLTIGLWFREDWIPSDNGIMRYLLDNRSYTLPDRGFQAYHGVKGAPLTTCSAAGCRTFSYVLGQWHHLLYRYDGTSALDGGGANIEIFLDGQPIATVTNTAGIAIFGPGVADLKVGYNTVFTVDDLVVYNTVLSYADQCTHIIGGTWNSGLCSLP